MLGCGQSVSTDYVNPKNGLVTLSQRLQALCSSVGFTETIHCAVEAWSLTARVVRLRNVET